MAMPVLWVGSRWVVLNREVISPRWSSITLSMSTDTLPLLVMVKLYLTNPPTVASGVHTLFTVMDGPSTACADGAAPNGMAQTTASSAASAAMDRSVSRAVRFIAIPPLTAGYGALCRGL